MSNRSLVMPGAAWAGLLLLVAAPPARAQTFAPAESVTVAPGPQFKAGALHRFFFGPHYRALWTTPIRVPVLHLTGFAGGLKPTQRGGGMQTKSLRLMGADGREYQFRSLEKDPSAVLPPELRHTVAADILRDQTSAQHPVGPLIVAPLLDAAGVLHTRPILVQLANDPDLGEFRSEFGGLLGTIEERPRDSADPGVTFAGARDIVSTDELYKKLDDQPAVGVDARAFLLARLTDVFLGDWDRHRDQWRWAKVGDGSDQRWLPIPRDRDQAFVRYDGFLPGVARRVNPQFLRFGPKYGPIVGPTWNGRDLDRRLLTSLERPVWDSIAATLKSRLTDRAIAQAVAELPPDLRRLDSARLERALRTRRDHLDQVADKYYRLLADKVDVYGSDKVDEARVLRQRSGGTVVTLAHNGTEYFHRTFGGETDEIRLYLQGGGDQLTVEGQGGGPTVRVVGGGGDDHFAVKNGSGVHLYDDRGANTAEGKGINRKPWSWKPDSTDPNALPPRDWGHRSLRLLTGYYATDVGAVIDYGGHTSWYGFRRLPEATRLDYRLQYSTGRSAFRFLGGVTRQFENSRGFLNLDLLASGIETLRWYGLGNETQQTGVRSFYKVNQDQLDAVLRLGTRLGERGFIGIGPQVRWSRTDLGSDANSERFIATDKPYGTGRFGMAGASAELRLDGRDFPGFATKGGYLMIKGSAFPKAWDLDEATGRVQAEGSIALAPQGSWRPSLNLFAGGIKTFGKTPFFETARLGGLRTLRGYNPDRFAGDAAVYGSAEVRLPLTRIKFVVPGQQGIFAFYDVGRVYVEGETSDELHTAAGGGVWLSFLSRASVVFVGAGRPTKDKEGTRIIVGFGFPY